MKDMIWMNLSEGEAMTALALKSNLWTKPKKLARILNSTEKEVRANIRSLIKNKYIIPIVNINWNRLKYDLYACLFNLRDNEDKANEVEKIDLVQSLVKTHYTLYLWENHGSYEYSVGVFNPEGKSIDENPV